MRSTSYTQLANLAVDITIHLSWHWTQL